MPEPNSIPGRYAMIELRRLRYMLAVAEELNVTRAAERLGMQQPPLTRQIRALETELGVALFQRLPRGVRRTADSRRPPGMRTTSTRPPSTASSQTGRRGQDVRQASMVSA